MAAFVASASVGSRAFLGAAVPRTVSAAPAAAPVAAPVRMMAEMSKSVPFLLKPKNLDGWAANAEFDPLGISDYVPVAYLRESELSAFCVRTPAGEGRGLFVVGRGWPCVVALLAARTARVKPLPACWSHWY